MCGGGMAGLDVDGRLKSKPDCASCLTNRELTRALSRVENLGTLYAGLRV